MRSDRDPSRSPPSDDRAPPGGPNLDLARLAHHAVRAEAGELVVELARLPPPRRPPEGPDGKPPPFMRRLSVTPSVSTPARVWPRFAGMSPGSSGPWIARMRRWPNWTRLSPSLAQRVQGGAGHLASRPVGLLLDQSSIVPRWIVGRGGPLPLLRRATTWRSFPRPGTTSDCLSARRQHGRQCALSKSAELARESGSEERLRLADYIIAANWSRETPAVESSS